MIWVPPLQLLGLEIYRDRPNRRLHLSQSQYIANLLQEHGMHDCKPVSTPLNPGSHLSTSMSPQNAAEASEMHQVPYICVVGLLMYLAVTTRPDIAYAAEFLPGSIPILVHLTGKLPSMFCTLRRAQWTSESLISLLIHLSHSSLILMLIMEAILTMASPLEQLRQQMTSCECASSWRS